MLRFVLIVFFFFFFINADGSAALIVTTGPFSLDDPKDHSVGVLISDGGQPVHTSTTTLSIKVIKHFSSHSGHCHCHNPLLAHI